MAQFGLKPVYLWEDNAQVFVRSDPGGKWFYKFPKQDETEIKGNTETVAHAVDARIQVSQADYEKSKIPKVKQEAIK